MSHLDSLAAHRQLVGQLAAAFRDRAFIKASDARARGYAFRSLNDGTRNITTVRAEVDAAQVDMTVELIEIDGEIDALQTELRGLEADLRYYEKGV
jgi:hypothetical protein